jgi:hypothetical protein
MEVRTSEAPQTLPAGKSLARLAEKVEKAITEFDIRNRKVWIACGIVVVFVGLCGGFVTILDNAGQIPHTQDTSVYVGRGDWANGESRECVAFPAKDGTIFFLGCVQGQGDYFTSEVMPVTYWGKTQRPDRFQSLREDPNMNGWHWRCQKKKGGVTCWAVN